MKWVEARKAKKEKPIGLFGKQNQVCLVGVLCLPELVECLLIAKRYKHYN
jgi:hypothetical protein